MFTIMKINQRDLESLFVTFKLIPNLYTGASLFIICNIADANIHNANILPSVFYNDLKTLTTNAR